MFPVGTIIERNDEISPASYIGGTWQKFAQGRMTIGANGTYPLGSTGGSADAVVVEHEHEQSMAIKGAFALFMQTLNGVKTNYGYTIDPPFSEGYSNAMLNTARIGVSGTGKNMPPYQATNKWVRLA